MGLCVSRCVCSNVSVYLEIYSNTEIQYTETLEHTHLDTHKPMHTL